MLGRSALCLVHHTKSGSCFAASATASKAAVARTISSSSSYYYRPSHDVNQNNVTVNHALRRFKSSQATRLQKKAIKVLLNNAPHNNENSMTNNNEVVAETETSIRKEQENFPLSSSNNTSSSIKTSKENDKATILSETEGKLRSSTELLKKEKQQIINGSTESLTTREAVVTNPDMTPRPCHDLHEFAPKIVVVGVGGAGGNALNNMIAKGLCGVDFLALNTDAQHLATTLTDHRLQLGVELTRGLGCGANPDAGRMAAEESRDLIREELEGAHLVFITAGMGGGTGTGAAPVIADICYQLGILTVGVVTMPFSFEGTHRKKLALQGIENMKSVCDTLITIPNQNLFRLAGPQTTFVDAFQIADDVLLGGVKSITDLMTTPGLINLDFADVQTVMVGMGNALLGTGVASSSSSQNNNNSNKENEEEEYSTISDDGYDDRAIRAATLALDNPLLGTEWDIATAKGMLVNITGGRDMTLFEVDKAAQLITERVQDVDANIIFGSAFDERLEGSIRVSVVATGIDQPIQEETSTAAGFENNNTINTKPKEEKGQRRTSKRGFFGFSA